MFREKWTPLKGSQAGISGLKLIFFKGFQTEFIPQF
jgi:hypothetical protein